LLTDGGTHAQGVILGEGESLEIVIDERLTDAIDLLQAQGQQ